jgi:WD40 repeat protein
MESKGDVVMEHIDLARSRADDGAFDLFIVYAPDDAEFVHGYLLPAINLPPSRVLLVDRLTPGALVVSEIERAVSRSRFTVAVLSPAYLADCWAALGEQFASYHGVDGAQLIPLRLKDAILPLRLEARVSLDFTDRARWEPEAARLRELLQTTPPADERILCPYPGMREFRADEADHFFGRQDELSDLIGRLDRGVREIYVIGPSGSGKSSLVQAGLLHALDPGASQQHRRFAARSMRPGELPIERLGKVLEGDPAKPAAAIDALLARHPPADRLLVFIDQLEELFTLASVDERQRFAAALRALRDVPSCYLVLALRADFFGALMESSLWPDLVGRISRIEVGPLRGRALAGAIAGPALRVGVYVEARLCDRLVAEAASEPGALPHVQETLRMLWEHRSHRVLGLTAYERLGDGGSGLHAALARLADSAMGTLTPAQQTIARRVLVRLVSFGEGRADTRRQQPVQALRSAVDEEEAFTYVLQHLVNHRLVTLDGAQLTDTAFADLSHESLITAWPALMAWIDRRRTDEQRRRRLEAKVDEWISHGCGRRGLLERDDLAEVQQWMQSDTAQLLGYSEQLPALVGASRDVLEKEVQLRRRRVRLTIGALATLSTIAIIFASVAWRNSREARRLLGVLYAQQGEVRLRSGHPMQALPFLLTARAQGIDSRTVRELFAEASRNLPIGALYLHDISEGNAPFVERWVVASLAGTAGARAALADSLLGSPDVQRLAPIVALSPDGTRVVTRSREVFVQIWDASTGDPVTPRPQRHLGTIRGVAFSADGRWIVTASDDHTAQVWEASTGEPASRALQHQGPVNAATFSLDGRRVATASSDRTAHVWDASTGALLRTLVGHSDAVTTVAFSPDGTRVITSGKDRTVGVWDALTGIRTASLEHESVVAATSISPDGTRVVTASDEGVSVWDISSGQRLPVLGEPLGMPHAVVFAEHGPAALAVGRDGNVRIWNASTGLPRSSALELGDPVAGGVFSGDGARVITISDTTARVWDVSTGNPLTAPLECHRPIGAAAFSRDGKRVITASIDNTVWIWDASAPLPAKKQIHSHNILREIDNINDSESPPINNGSLENWRQVAECGPYKLGNNTAVVNPVPTRRCNPSTP